MSLRFEVSGVDDAIKKINQYLERKHKELVGAVADSAARTAIDAKKKAPVDLGNLRDGIVYTVKTNKNAITGDVLSSEPYSAFVEFGTRAHWAPASALEGWAQRHGVPVGAVLRSIAKKGTPAQPFMLPAAMKIKRKFIRSVKKVLKSP